MRGNLVACNPWKRASLAERWSLFKRVIKELPPQVHDGRYRKDWNVSRKLRRGTSGWTLKIWVIVSGFKQSKHWFFVSLAAIWTPPPPRLAARLALISYAASYLGGGLGQNLIVLGQRHQEHDGGHVLEAVDPFPPLWTLAAHIHHPAAKRKRRGKESPNIAVKLNILMTRLNPILFRKTTSFLSVCLVSWLWCYNQDKGMNTIQTVIFQGVF